MALQGRREAAAEALHEECKALVEETTEAIIVAWEAATDPIRRDLERLTQDYIDHAAHYVDEAVKHLEST